MTEYMLVVVRGNTKSNGKLELLLCLLPARRKRCDRMQGDLEGFRSSRVSQASPRNTGTVMTE